MNYYNMDYFLNNSLFNSFVCVFMVQNSDFNKTNIILSFYAIVKLWRSCKTEGFLL